MLIRRGVLSSDQLALALLHYKKLRLFCPGNAGVLVGKMSNFIAARIGGEVQAATGLNEFTSEGSGWKRMPKSRKGCTAKPEM